MGVGSQPFNSARMTQLALSELAGTSYPPPDPDKIRPSVSQS